MLLHVPSLLAGARAHVLVADTAVIGKNGERSDAHPLGQAQRALCKEVTPAEPAQKSGVVLVVAR